MSDSTSIPTPTDLAHDLNRAKVEIRAELREVKDDLRIELKDAIKAQGELLVTGGVARHEKAILRIDALTDAQHVFTDNLSRVPTQLDREASRLTELFEEKLRAVNIRIDTFHDYASAMRENAKEALSSALASADKIASNQRDTFEQQISKSETSFTKEIDGLKVLINATKDAITADVSNITGRLDRGEGGYQGARIAVGDRQASTTVNTQVVGQIIAFFVVVLMIIGVFVALHQPSGNPTVGADTKRVDDLILQNNEQNRQMGQRMDALSARLNQLTPLPKFTPPAQ